MRTAVALLVLLLQVTACQPEPGNTPPDQPIPEQSTPDPSTHNPPVQTSPFTLTPAPPELDPSPERMPGTGAFRGVLTTGSALGTLDFRYDAYVITATFGSFTPLTYRLLLPAALKVEGRIHAPPTLVPVPSISSGLITLENPRPDALKHYVSWLSEKVSGN